MPHGEPSEMTDEKLIASLNCHDDLDAEVAKRLRGYAAEISRLNTVQGAAGVLLAADPVVIMRVGGTLWNMDNFLAMLLALVEDKTP